MNWLDVTLPSPAENLALDEVLLEATESFGIPEFLRFWESSRHFVVVGYANKVATEVNLDACNSLGIPVLRRITGGGTVLQGPGVLNYALVLQVSEQSPLATITGANQFIMQRNAEALTQMLAGSSGSESGPFDAREQSGQPKPFAPVQVLGHTDLAIANRKFSGNAQRRKRNHLLFHGSILLNLDLDLLDATLPMPSLQPDYRGGRSHRSFLVQLNASAESVKQALCQGWSAIHRAKLDSLSDNWQRSVEKLVTEKYSRPEWNFRL